MSDRWDFDRSSLERPWCPPEPRARVFAGLVLALALSGFSPPAFAIVDPEYHELFSATGEAPTDQFGVAATAGDFDGDGVPDVLVGAPSSDAGGANSGRAYVYSGRRLTDPPLVITGQAGERLGWTTAAAGDVNGDGWDDIILGAPFNDVGGIDAGRAYVYFGGPNADATPDLTLTGLAAGEQFGSAVASAGDMNGDGYDDLIVGAHLSDAGGMDAGSAYVFYGGAVPNAGVDLTLNGQAGDQFGFWSSSAGDINADGYGDIVVGAWLNDAAGIDAGAAYVYYGGVVAETTPDLTLLGSAAGERFGVPAVQAGDVDADGHPDLLVGASSNDVAGTDAGAAYLFRGGPAADAVPDLTMLGIDGGDGFGSTPSAAGDVNGDGYSDFVVGAPSAGPNTDGLAYLYLGGPSLDGTADLVLGPPTSGDAYASYIEPAGDIDLDGYDDLILADFLDDAAGTNAGRVSVVAVYPYRILLPTGGDVWPVGGRVTVMWRGHTPADLELSVDGGLTFETVASSAGGLAINSLELMCRPQIAVRAKAKLRVKATGQVATRANSVVSREVEIEPYPAKLRVTAESAVTVAESGDDTTHVVVTGDVNADGLPDLVIGRPAVNSGAGKVSVYLGSGRTASGRPKFQATAVTLGPGIAGEGLGWSVAIGDVNGDCVGDIVVGAPRSDPNSVTDAGRVVGFFGSAAFEAVPDYFLEGNIAGEQFGYSVATVADMNGDEYDDIAVGAPFSNANGTGSGRVRVYHGGTAPDATADVTVNGEAAGDNLGTSIAGLPDPTGEGRDWCEIFPWLCPVLSGALLMGAPFNDVGGMDAGAAYVLLGGSGADAAVDMFMRGSQPGSHFGMKVASIGDVDGDRIDDIAISAPDEDGLTPPIPDMGRVRVRVLDPRCFVIDPWPDPGPDPWFRTLDGAAAGDRFGLRLDAADVNYDGLSDLVVATPDHDGPTGLDAGRVSIFYGIIGPPASAGDIGPNHGVNPDFLIDGAAAGDRLGDALALIDWVGFGVWPDAIKLQPTALRRACVGRHKAKATPAGATHDPEPEPDAPPPMIGGDLVLAKRGALPAVQVFDMNRYHLLAPTGTATWNVGGLQTVTWSGPEPVAVQLSVDGGATYETIATSPGGSRVNSATIRVPHLPTRFGMLRLVPWPPCPPDPFGLTCPPFFGFAESDTPMTIQASISLLSFAAQRTESGAELTWSTDPGISPEGITGYRLYRVEPGATGDGARIGPELIVEHRHLDADARPGVSYRLAAVNGLGEELELGRTFFELNLAGMRVSPSPVSSRGLTTITFAAPMAAPGVSASDLDVGVFDVTGRRVATLASGYVRPRSGVVDLEWRPGRRGEEVHPGMYFIRATAASARFRVEHKVVVIP